MIDPKFVDEELARETTGAPCQCGGYMDRAYATREEGVKARVSCMKERCCAVTFTCRICGDKSTLSLPAPEMDFR